jgi:hypothetical protein
LKLNKSTYPKLCIISEQFTLIFLKGHLELHKNVM